MAVEGRLLRWGGLVCQRGMWTEGERVGEGGGRNVIVIGGNMAGNTHT